MDKERSKYISDVDFPEDAGKITHLVLDTSKIPEDLLLFRLKEKRSVIIAHQRVQQALTVAGITGIKFIEPGQFSI